MYWTIKVGDLNQQSGLANLCDCQWALKTVHANWGKLMGGFDISLSAKWGESGVGHDGLAVIVLNTKHVGRPSTGGLSIFKMKTKVKLTCRNS